MPIQSEPVSSGASEQLASELQQFAEDCRYLASHRDSLLKRYPEQWVAVYGGKVVAHGTNINVVMRELRSKGAKLNRTAIEFLTKKRKTLIL